MSDDLRRYLEKQEAVENGCLVAIGIFAAILVVVAALSISGIV